MPHWFWMNLAVKEKTTLTVKTPIRTREILLASEVVCLRFMVLLWWGLPFLAIFVRVFP